MPELPVMEGRLPELRLPEISRDEIIRSFSEIRRPDLDKAILGLAAATRLVRPAVRSRRLPLSLGFLAVAGLATFALLSRPAVRDRLARTAREARRRAMEARGGPEILEVEADVPFEHEVTTAIAIPIEPDAFTDATDVVAEVADETDVAKVVENVAEKSAELA